MPSGDADAVRQRQERERAYHAGFAEENRAKLEQPVALDVVSPGPRRPWNGYWSAYDALMALQPEGKRVLVPGCGFGEDAIRLASLRAEVFASDLSPDLLDIARERARRMGLEGITFSAASAEQSGFPDDFFDIVFFNDILHHADIPAAVAEARRVTKPGGGVVVNELYTHSSLQRIRESRLVNGVLYKRMVRFIYGTGKPYITEDERKINERELAHVESLFQPGMTEAFFLLVQGRLLPLRWRTLAQIERAVLRPRPIGRMLAARVVISGTVRKTAGPA